MTDSASGPGSPDRQTVLERIEAFGLRVPFTLATVSMLALAGWLTNNAVGERLGSTAVGRLGFAPADTASFDLARAFMSAFVTSSPAAFWVAIVATATFAGLVEWRHGSLSAGIAFWGTHFVTLALSWALLIPLHLAGDASARLLFLSRDVGPSAGYVGCLGYLLYDLTGRIRLASLALGILVLAAVLAFNVRALSSQPAEVSAALSHLIALPVGFLLGRLRSRMRRKPAGDARTSA